MLFRQRDHFTACIDVAASGKEHIGCSFGQHPEPAVFHLMDRCHQLAVRVEGQFALARIFLLQLPLVCAYAKRIVNKCGLCRITDDGFAAFGLLRLLAFVDAGVIAQRHRLYQPFTAGKPGNGRSGIHPLPIYIQLLHSHLVQCQRSGLVRADNFRAAQRFYRRELADNGFALGHPLHTECQYDGHDGWQPFRYSGYGQ
ncbi:hypothetical protein D3C76_623130 [compost metagenome]